MLHNFILSVCVGDSQSNDITIHNENLIVVSMPVSRGKKHSTPTTTLTHNL